MHIYSPPLTHIATSYYCFHLHISIAILYIVCVVAVVAGILCYKRMSKERIESNINPLYTPAHLQLETFNTRPPNEGEALTYENSQYVPSTSQTQTESSNQPIYDEIETNFYEMDDVIGESDAQTKQVEVGSTHNSNSPLLTSPRTAGHFADPLQRL